MYLGFFTDFPFELNMMTEDEKRSWNYVEDSVDPRFVFSSLLRSSHTSQTTESASFLYNASTMDYYPASDAMNSPSMSMYRSRERPNIWDCKTNAKKSEPILLQFTNGNLSCIM